MTAPEALSLLLLIQNKMRLAVWIAKLVRKPQCEATLALAGGDWRHPSLRGVCLELWLREVLL